MGIMSMLIRKLSGTSKKQHGDYFEVTVTDDFVKVEHPDWLAPQRIRWNDVDTVRMINTSLGPWAPDVWLILEDKNQRCMIPLGAKGFEEVYQIVSKYEGFDFDNFSNSMCCANNSDFLLWTGSKIKSNEKQHLLIYFLFYRLYIFRMLPIIRPRPGYQDKVCF